jgi:hypothetical protein
VRRDTSAEPPVPDPLTATLVAGACRGGPAAAASGQLADDLGELFIDIRDRVAPIAAAGRGGGVLVLVRTDEPPPTEVVTNAVRALVRGLARETGASGVRVNAVVTATGRADPAPMVEFLSGPAATALTGAVFDVRV